MTDDKKGFTLSNRTYDVLNNIVKYLLPALGTFYFTIASIWGFLYAEQVVGSLAALATLLAVVIFISNRNYTPEYDGSLLIDESDPTKDNYLLEVETPLEDIKYKDDISLHVQKAIVEDEPQ